MIYRPKGRVNPLRLASIAAAAAATVAAAVVLAATPWADSAHADHSASTIGLIAVDVDTAANTATSLGPTDTCVRIEPGASVVVDVVVNAIPSDRPMIGFQFNLLYDPAVVTVTDNDLAMLIASSEPFSPFVSANDPLPDSDGTFLVAIVDAGAQEIGPGVLSRITLGAGTSGVATLSLTNIQVRDDQNEVIPIDALGAANLAVGQDCPPGIPSPASLTPGTQPAPGAQPDQTAEEGPVPGAGTSDTGTGIPGAEGTPTTLPGTGGTPSAGGATPGPGTPTADETTDASGTPGQPATPAAGGADLDTGGDSDGGGVGAWIAAPIAAGVLALLATGYVAFRRIRGRAA